MGKGNRNRENHLTNQMNTPAKVQKKKRATSEWLPSVIALVIVVALLVGVAASLVVSNGLIKRGRILVDSQTGKFDVNQQMATFIAWQGQYYNSYYYYLYAQYGMITGDEATQITSTYDSADEYALAAAQYSMMYALRDSVDDVLESIVKYVAVADAAWEAGVRLDDAEKDEVKQGIEELKTMQKQTGYTSLNSFLSTAIGEGMKKGDVKDALELIALYDKYNTMQKVEFEKAVTLADLTAWRDTNPEDFYKIDYLTYAADNEDFAKELAAVADADAFRALVMKHHLETNYKTVYNQLTTQKTANEELASLSGKQDANEGTALSDALDTLGAEEKKTYNKDDAELNADLKKWLFTETRQQYETGVVTSENGIYLVAFYSAEPAKGDVKTVDARCKYYEFVEGETHGEDTSFKSNILLHITESKKDEPNQPTVNYKNASELATAFEAQLKAEGANVTVLMRENGGLTVNGVESSTTADKLPTIVRDAVLKDGVKQDDIITVNSDGVYYVIAVIARTETAANVTYAKFENDLYYNIIDELSTSLDKIYPEKASSIAYDKDAAADSFEAWISEVKEDGKFVSARVENEKKYFKVTKDSKDTFNVYIVVKNEMATDSPMYLDTAEVVRGGYLLYSQEDHAAEAQAALNTLANKTGVQLTDALTTLNTSATVSNTLKNSDSLDANLAAWLFAADRTPNTTATIANTLGTGTYVAVFVEKGMTWEINAKSAFVDDKLNTWAEELAKSYTPRAKTLEKLGEPSTTAETTAANTAADTTAAQ